MTTIEHSFLTRVVSEVQNAVLLLGIGGGYDIYSGLPFYFELLDRFQGTEKKIVLANFSDVRKLEEKPGEQLTLSCKKVDATQFTPEEKQMFLPELGYPRNYYPEYHLSNYLSGRLGTSVPVYAFSKTSVEELRIGYQHVITAHGIDTVLLHDAGVDSLLRGDEHLMGTFTDDFMTLSAMSAIPRTLVPRQYLVCLGLGTEAHISEHDFFENLGHVQSMGGYFGAIALVPEMRSVQEYIRAVDGCIPCNTGVNSSIIPSIEGHFGEYREARLVPRGIPWILVHPLARFYWFFDAFAVTDPRHNPMIQAIRGAQSRLDAFQIIEARRPKEPLRRKGGLFFDGYRPKGLDPVRPKRAEEESVKGRCRIE
eukprot:gnl/Trimastix_PCT/987.p2 GENE.gnl/Trimastix_PCT/987~~gnl/Trimastix_PCT/987.p2  ORF type:complete len:367 (+),score=99.21 gnl/Trimastix_PCT/987:2011-3111(+)